MQSAWYPRHPKGLDSASGLYGNAPSFAESVQSTDGIRMDHDGVRAVSAPPRTLRQKSMVDLRNCPVKHVAGGVHEAGLHTEEQPRRTPHNYPTVNTRRKATGGLPDHKTPSDPHICATKLQYLFECLNQEGPEAQHLWLSQFVLLIGCCR